jgi:RNA polymerase sigma-70 factor (ECF subfamily)
MKAAPTNEIAPCITCDVNGLTVSLDDEHVVIHRAQQGDRSAFALLAKRYWDRLYRWLYHLAHDQHTAEDLAQEAFMKALAKLATFRAGHSFQAWLFRIAHNSFLNQKRSARKVVHLAAEELASPQEGPADQAISRESLQLLARAVGRLPTDFRAAFLLRSQQELSFREIAEVLQTSEETARWRVFKARQKLMEVVGAEPDQD